MDQPKGINVRQSKRFVPGDLVVWKRKYWSSRNEGLGMFIKNPTTDIYHTPLIEFKMGIWTVVTHESGDYVCILAPEGIGWTGAEFIEKL